MNKLECCKIWDLKPYNADGSLNGESIKNAMFKMKDCGVEDKVIIHSKTKSFVLDIKTEEFGLGRVKERDFSF